MRTVTKLLGSTVLVTVLIVAGRRLTGDATETDDEYETDVKTEASV